VGEGRITITMSKLGFPRSSKDIAPNTENLALANEQAVITEEDDIAAGATKNGKDKDKDKEHNPFHHHKKDRTKSKSREKEEKKEKGKPKDKDGSGKEGGEPDRECTVM